MFGKEKEQKQEKIQSKWHHYLISILFVLVGILFVSYEQMDVSFVCKLFAIVFAAAGIVSIISYFIKDVDTGYYRLDLAYGVMALFIALLFITGKEAVEAYFPMIAGIILLGNGVIKLQHSIDMKRIDRKMKKVTEMWLVVMIFALIGIAAGLITVYLTPEKPRTLFILTGIALIVAGLSDMFTHIVFGKKVRAFKNTDSEAEEPETADDTEPVTPDAKEEPVTETAEETPDESASSEEATEAEDDGDKVLFEVETQEDDTDKES